MKEQQTTVPHCTDISVSFFLRCPLSPGWRAMPRQTCLSCAVAHVQPGCQSSTGCFHSCVSNALLAFIWKPNIFFLPEKLLHRWNGNQCPQSADYSEGDSCFLAIPANIINIDTYSKHCNRQTVSILVHTAALLLNRGMKLFTLQEQP